MADENAGGTQAEPTPASMPQAGVTATTAANGTQAEPTSGHPGSENMSLDEAKKLRAESASLRKRLAELEARAQQDELAKLSEAEKVTRERDSLREQNAALLIEQQSYRLAREIARHAPSLNLIDPDAAMLMLQAGGEIDYDADGAPSNVGKLLEKLIAEKPYLVASNVTRPPMPPSVGATNPGRSAAAQPPAARPDPKAVYQQHRQSGGLANRNLWKRGSGGS